MSEITRSLFGVTAEQYQRERERAAEQESRDYAQMNIGERSSYMLREGGRGLGNIIGRALGGEDPELRRISRRNQILGTIDPSRPETFEMAAQAALESDQPDLAFGLRAEAETKKRSVLESDALIFQRMKEKEAPTPPMVEEFNFARTPEGGGFEGTYQEFVTARNTAGRAPPMVEEFNFARTPEGGGFEGTYQQFVTARAAAGRAPVAPRAEPQPQPPVAVIDPVTGKTIFVSRDEALTRRMTPAAAGEGISPKEMQKRNAAFPQATSAIRGVEAKSVEFINSLKALRNHPGLSSITGIVAGRFPGITNEGRAAEALYDTVTSLGGFQELQEMRSANATGGALGNVSNYEGQQLRASFAAIDRRQEAKDVIKAIDLAIEGIEGAKTRMREAYDSTYEYKESQDVDAPPGAAQIPGQSLAPIYATNGKDRIMSTDGGKTWSPTR